ncbi:uncharacterized protein [Dermacentor albipictus]|uniref:uncharacterized protein n=1 Tax=Dermacentor albipictus TaxID=60249 RepID=UPI0038FC57CB
MLAKRMQFFRSVSKPRKSRQMMKPRSWARGTTLESISHGLQLGKLDDPNKLDAGCFMVRQFCHLARLCRLMGCFHIGDLNEQAMTRASIKWRTPYVVYSAVWLFFVLFLQGLVLGNKISRLTSSATFTKALVVTVRLFALANALANIYCITIRANGLLEFLRKAARFETLSGFPPPSRRSVASRRRCFFAFQKVAKLAVAVAAFAVLLTALFGPSSLASVRYRWNVVIKILSAFADVVFIFYESVMYLVLSCAAEVLVHYMKAQLRAFDNCQRCVRAAPCKADLALEVEAIRGSVSSIREMKACLNDMWNPAILTSSVCLLWSQCISLYCLFADRAARLDVWLGFFYSWYCSLRFLELAVISHDLRMEAQNIKDATKNVTMAGATSTYLRQVRYLHDTIDPAAMCLTGASFFRLDRPLLVSITGAVITYTVIVVQTNEQLVGDLAANLTMAVT